MVARLAGPAQHTKKQLSCSPPSLLHPTDTHLNSTVSFPRSPKVPRGPPGISIEQLELLLELPLVIIDTPLFWLQSADRALVRRQDESQMEEEARATSQA